ncbi:MAG: DUF4834 family protein [Rikenellaceae bacterium]
MFLLIFLAIAAPSLFFGALQVIFYIIAGIVILLAILSLIFKAKIRRLQRDMEQQMGGDQQQQRQTYGDFFSGRQRTNRRSDDDVKIFTQSGAGEKKVAEDVGDYVDFEEVKEKR